MQGPAPEKLLSFMATYKSKQTLVSKAPYELYMAVTDLRNIINMLPQDKREGVTADSDSIHATVQGFSIGVRVTERSPYNLLKLKDDGAPFSFSIELHFDQAAYASQTLFHIVVEALSEGLNLLLLHRETRSVHMSAEVLQQVGARLHSLI